MKRTAVATLLVLAGTVALVAVGMVGWAWYQSRLPDTYSVMDYAVPEYGGGTEPTHGAHADGEPLTRLHGPDGTPDVRFTLTARRATVTLASGRTVDALTFDGRVPGPELRVRHGDLVEVTLRNADVERGVTIHWHGVDVPGAEDGVAGVTQDAVPPGGSFTYRFRADQEGTFWYHSHQASDEQVRRGLFGALVIEPSAPPASGSVDATVVAHTLDGIPLLNAGDGLQHRPVAPGTRVRLRLVNSDNTPQRFVLSGVPFRVVAIDGTDLSGPTPIRGQTLELAGGGRYDVAFTMPRTPVGLSLEGTDAMLALSSDGAASPRAVTPEREFDPASYGAPAPTPFGLDSRFDRTFALEVGRKPGFLDGRPGMQWALNGHIFPRVPMFVVEEGDLVRVSIDNTSGAVHPMHLHGHHMLVLSRDGEPVTGSAWWSDTLNVEAGERYEVAFRADNPGIWMDHCHNLAHAAAGLTMHVAYVGVTTPFETGGAAHKHPE